MVLLKGGGERDAVRLEEPTIRNPSQVPSASWEAGVPIRPMPPVV